MEKIYHLQRGKYVWKHKGTGVITDSLFKLEKAMKKTAVKFLKQAGKKVAEKGINKVSDVVVKKAGDKIDNVLRKRKQASEAGIRRGPKPVTKTKNDTMARLNQLISSL